MDINPDTRPSFFERLSSLLLREPEDREQLIKLLHSAHERELLDADALSITEGALAASEISVSDVMVPRAQMQVIDIDDPLDKIIAQLNRTGHSRFPVIDGDRDQVIGILLAKDFLRLKNNVPFNLRDWLRPVVFIPESKRLSVLLREFRVSHNHLAVVVDEYASVCGLITIEDVLEQIVGEIEDEFDIAGDEGDIFGLSDHTYRVSGDTPVERVCEAFGVSIRSSDPEEDFDTIGGLIAHELGHVPRRGEHIALAGLHFVVLHTKGGAVRWFKVSTQGPASNDPGIAEDASA